MNSTLFDTSEESSNSFSVIDTQSYSLAEIEDDKRTVGISIDMSPINEDEGAAFESRIHDAETKFKFDYNLQNWHEETCLMSTGNFSNLYFESIVNMGYDAVPYILEKISERPSKLVYALDLIFPGVVEYEGYVPLDEVCRVWLEILTQK